MQIEIITINKQKSWTVLKDCDTADHFHTGYTGFRNGGEIEGGNNVIITADFKIDGMSRGQSAANFHGAFRDHEFPSYEMGIQGTLELLRLIQSGEFPIVDGHIRGRWSFAKQGSNIFLKPYTGA